MNKREKAIQELKKQMYLARERLGPEGVKELENLAKGLYKPKAATATPPAMVPYDKKAALSALEIFLKNHGDPKTFEKRLRDLIKNTIH
jgi:hypothetical protein